MEMANGKQDFTVSDIILTLRRQYKVVIGVPLVVTAAAVIFALTLKDTYEVDGSLEIGRVMEYPLEAPTTVVDRMASKSFLGAVARKLGMKETPAELENMVEVESIFAESRDRPLTRGIKVTVQADSPQKGTDFVKGILEKALAEQNEIFKSSWQINYDYLVELEENINRIRTQIDEGRAEISRMAATGRVDQVQMSYLASYVEEKESYIIHLEEAELELRQKLLMGIYTHPTRITAEPVLPVEPSGPRRRLIVLLAFVISFALGVIIAFFFDRLPREEEAARAPVDDEKKKEPPLEATPTPVEPTPAPVEPTPERAGPEPPREPPAEVNRLPEERNLMFSDFWRILRSQAWVVATTLLLGLALGLIYGFLKPREFKADFVVSVGIVGDHWIHSPMVTEESCKSHWFLDKLSSRLNRKYDVFELEDMVEAELIMTPTKGLTRELRITVKAESPGDCFALAENLADLLTEADKSVYEDTHKMFESYLGDLERVMAGITAQPGAAGPSALAPGLTIYPPDEETEYKGGAQVYSLFSRSIPYEENPYAISSLALFQQVYIDTYVKTRSTIFSQPTTVVVPPLKPTKPEGPGPVSIVLIVLIVSLVLGVTLAAVNYRLQRARARP
jgi:uncharacterized protein involved in exopolysaccharide biosynthesis